MTLSTFHAGFFLAGINGLTLPERPRRYIRPTAQGDGSGRNWANAASLAAINTMIALAALVQGDVWVRADLGSYAQDTTRTINSGGSDLSPVRIMGVDGDGNPMMPQLVGSRMVDASGVRLWNATADRAAGVYGKEVFRLNIGADNLLFSHIHWVNQGRGCIRIREPIRNLGIIDCRADNVASFLVNGKDDAGSAALGASCVGLTVQRVEAYGFSKTFINLSWDTRDILIEDCIGDSQRQDGDLFASGIVATGRARDAIVRRCWMGNCIDTMQVYQNGDGFALEYSCRNWRYEYCVGFGNSDSAFDIKSDDAVLFHCDGIGCPRNFRGWGYETLLYCRSINPAAPAGPPGKTMAHFAAFEGSNVRMYGCSASAESGRAPALLAEGGGLIAHDAACVFNIPEDAPIYKTEPANDGLPAGIAIAMPTYSTLPAVTSPTYYSVDENVAAQIVIEDASRPTSLRVLNSSATTFSRRGPKLSMFPQDYEAMSIPVATAEAQLMDAMGQVSAITPINVGINDLPDNRVDPAEYFHPTYGATAGAWWLPLPQYCWQDIAGTVPAEVDAPVARVDDLSPWLHHMLQEDPEAQAILRVIGGSYGLEWRPGGRQFYNIGAPGDFNFAAATLVMMHRRGSDPATDENGNAIPRPQRQLFHVPQAASGSNNARLELALVGGASVNFTMGGLSTSSPGIGGEQKSARVLTMVTPRSLVRSRPRGTEPAVIYDGSDGRTITYPSLQQARIGASLRTDGSVGNFYNGIWFGGCASNRDEGDVMVPRVESTFASYAGLTI